MLLHTYDLVLVFMWIVSQY